MKKLSALIALSLCATSVAYAAQDGSSCANAIPIAGSSNPVPQSTVTTGQTNWVGAYQGVASGGADVAYTFTTGAEAPTGNITWNNSSWATAGLFLLSTCNDPTDGSTVIVVPPGWVVGSLDQDTAADDPVLPLSGLQPNKQYWILIGGVTGDTSDANNGTVAWTLNPTFPVSLQSFEID